ncbi:PTS sugar transporter subunit IIB [Affinibrenneria salicis]|uniref:PTS sugar transporter subunit IIB n=1 Tax=Affinibrenneria salicis TaxID=2590031 RepID=A0A5J5FZ84_9GAMM|nr:PTS sugar transporter subunit IIB [Affinibrenneria salicis]KAA8999345.1 PTS sugar transporter subunit IIB [Affinibrenneria salicis]
MSQKTIMLICSAGMSTSLLVSKMQKAAEERGLALDIFAISSAAFEEEIASRKIDVILLGPQVKYMRQQLAERVSGENIPVDVIPMVDYGTMNGAKVLDLALTLMA